jgi:hypothetical protein
MVHIFLLPAFFFLLTTTTGNATITYMPAKNYDLVKPMSIKFDADSERELRREAVGQTIPISALVRKIVRQHFKLNGSKKR